MGKSSAPETQTVINKTELPAWINSAGQKIMTGTEKAAETMLAPYSGNRVAGQNADTTAAYGMARGAAGMAQPYMDAAGAASGAAAAFQPGQVQAQNFLQGNVGAYMDPYLDAVETNGLAAIEKQRKMALTGVGENAFSRGAFGGSRQGIQEAVTNTEAIGKARELSANIRSQGFQNAQGMMASDMNRALQAGQSNQQAGLGAAQIWNQAGIGLANIGQGAQQAGLQGASAMEGIGAAQRSYEQQLLQQDALRYEQMRQFPFEKIAKPLAAIGAIPTGSTSTTTGPATQQGSNPMLGGFAGLSGGLGLASALGGAGGFLGAGGTAGLGGLGALLGFMSDEKTKTNIEKVGKDPDTGLPIYAYDYKADVAAAKREKRPMGPKRVGPMAQDIEKRFPGSTRKVGGKLTIPGGLGLGQLQVG